MKRALDDYTREHGWDEALRRARRAARGRRDALCGCRSCDEAERELEAAYLDLQGGEYGRDIFPVEAR